MRARWARSIGVLAVWAVLEGCQGTNALQLTNLSMRDSVTIAPVVNTTGLSLSLPPDNPLTALRRELGARDEEPVNVPDILQTRLLLAFQTHGYQVMPLDKSSQFPDGSGEIVKLVEKARGAGLEGRIVLATIRRWDDSRWVSVRAVFVSMDITLARIHDDKILEVRTLRNYAVPVGAATTIVQASDDAARWLAERLF